MYIILQDFKNRLKNYRRASVDKNRDTLGVSRIVHEGYKDIEALLLSDEEAVEFLDQNNLFNLLNDVQKEILEEELQEQAEKHEKELQTEINSIVNNSLTTCTICEKTIATLESDIICDNCVKHFEGDV